MKYMKYDDQIFSLQNVCSVELLKDEAQHSRLGKKYTVYRYTIGILYFDNREIFIRIPDDEAQEADKLFNDIFNELNKERS